MTQQKSKKEIQRIKKVLPIDELIQKKSTINLFNSIYQKKIEFLYVSDMIFRFIVFLPFVLLSVFLPDLGKMESLSFIFSFVIFFIGISATIQSHYFFNNIIYKNKKSNIPFIKKIMERYFISQNTMQFLMIHYRKLSKEEMILLNSIIIPISGCNFYLYNLEKRIHSLKSEVIFKNKEIISLAIKNIEDEFNKQQILTIFNKKLNDFDKLQIEKKLGNL
jgi:hypothetical protein